MQYAAETCSAYNSCLQPRLQSSPHFLQMMNIFINSRCYESVQLRLLSHANWQNLFWAVKLRLQYILYCVEQEWRHDLQNKSDQSRRYTLDVGVHVNDD